MIKTITDVSPLCDIMYEFHYSAERLHGFYKDIFRDSWNGLIRQGLGRAYMWEDGEIKGFLLSLISRDLYDGEKNAMIAVWYVRPKYTGEGIGQCIYRAFEDDAIEAGAKRILGGYFLPVDTSAIAFHKNGLMPVEIFCAKKVKEVVWPG